MESSKTNSWNVRPYQQEILKVFREFERICISYGLRYFAIGGTALGAIRHKGFIPWDDDFDVAMPREDYIKFTEVVAKELNPESLQFCRGGGSAPVYFSKILNVKKGLVEEMRTLTNLDLTIPPFIDIFILDGVPDKVQDILVWTLGRRLLRLVQVFRFPEKGPESTSKRLLSRVLGSIASPFFQKTKTNDEMMSLMDDFAMKWSYGESKMVAEFFFCRLMFPRIFSKFDFEPARSIPFEDGCINVPARVEEYLTRFFGDYMTPPPIEYQVPEHIFKRAYNHV